MRFAVADACIFSTVRALIGSLAAGDYSFSALTSTGGFTGINPGTAVGSSSFSFTLQFTPADSSPTPEPGSLLLLGTGIAGVFGYRRRSANSRE